MSDSGTYVWGGLTWKLLHGLASLGLRGAALRRFIEAMGLALPCDDCRHNLERHMGAHAFEWDDGERAVFELHATVSAEVHPGYEGPSLAVVRRRAGMVDRHFTATDLVSLMHIIFNVCGAERGSGYEDAVCEFIEALIEVLARYRPDLAQIAKGLRFCHGCLHEKGGHECARYMLTLAPPLMVVLS